MKVLATPRSFGKNNPELFDILRDAGLDVVRNDTGGILSADRMCEKLADCDGLIVGVDPVDATVLAAAPRLRAIAKYGVGLDNIDLAACEARGIKVSRTVGANSEAVADYALALLPSLPAGASSVPAAGVLSRPPPAGAGTGCRTAASDCKSDAGGF